MIFDFGKNKLNEEIIAGLTIFLASSYVLFLNPQIMAAGGMDFDGAFFATGLAAAIGTLLVALIANKPYVIAPGITLSAFFTYSLVRTHDIAWQIALGASVLVGVILFVLSISKIRVWFVEAVPLSLRYGILGGIGLLLVFVGLNHTPFLSPSTSTGSLISAQSLYVVFGFFISLLLFVKNVRGAFLIGILLTTLLSVFVSYYEGTLTSVHLIDFPKNLNLVALKFDIPELVNTPGAFSIVLALFVVAFFDTIGTSTALLIHGKHVDKQKRIKDLDRVMVSDSLATIFGSALGASPQTVYAESASAYQAGGKTGLTAIIVCILFCVSLFFLPLIKLVPLEATASVLIIVGLIMLGNAKNIDLGNYSESIPAFLCLATIPFTFSISYGIGLGIITYVFLKIFLGRIKEVHLGMHLTALLFLLDFLNLF